MVWNVILCNLFYFQFDFLFLLLFYDTITGWLVGWQSESKSWAYILLCWLVRLGCCAMLHAADCLTDSDCIRIYDILIWCQVIRLKIPSFRPIINLISLWCPLMLWCYALCCAVPCRVALCCGFGTVWHWGDICGELTPLHGPNAATHRAVSSHAVKLNGNSRSVFGGNWIVIVLVSSYNEFLCWWAYRRLESFEWRWMFCCFRLWDPNVWLLFRLSVIELTTSVYSERLWQSLSRMLHLFLFNRSCKLKLLNLEIYLKRITLFLLEIK